MSVIKIRPPENPRAIDVLKELTELELDGRLEGFEFSAKVSRQRKPMFGVAGCFRSEPYEGLAALELLRHKLSELAMSRESHQETPS